MKLALQIALSSVLGLMFFAAALFVSAGTVHYWQAWVFIAVFSVATLVPSLILAKTDPAALRRRMQVGPTKETRPAQRFIISVTWVLVIALLVISGLDHRFGWSSVPVWLVVVGDVLVVLGLLLSQLVVFQNSYAASTVRVEQGQQLASTGLYAVVRHPMYTFALILLLGIPLALGSYWGLTVLVPAVAVLVARILDEEKMLVEQLPGYRQYTAQVRHRLIPKVW